jgi:hypothetical protein
MDTARPLSIAIQPEHNPPVVAAVDWPPMERTPIQGTIIHVSSHLHLERTPLQRTASLG